MFEELKERHVSSIGEELYRKYSVMVPLLKRGDMVYVLFERRSDKLKRQPGEICFPGGAREGDESSRENAVRETSEELCISRDQIRVIAHMDTLFTVYSNQVSVYMCELTGYEMTFSKDEVAEVFLVPLQYFLENKPEVYQTTLIQKTPDDFPYDSVPGGREYNWRHGKRNVYFYFYMQYTIWGMTAYIMHSVVSILKNEASGSLPQEEDDDERVRT